MQLKAFLALVFGTISLSDCSGCQKDLSHQPNDLIAERVSALRHDGVDLPQTQSSEPMAIAFLKESTSDGNKWSLDYVDFEQNRAEVIATFPNRPDFLAWDKEYTNLYVRRAHSVTIDGLAWKGNFSNFDTILSFPSHIGLFEIGDERDEHFIDIWIDATTRKWRLMSLESLKPEEQKKNPGKDRARIYEFENSSWKQLSEGLTSHCHSDVGGCGEELEGISKDGFHQLGFTSSEDPDLILLIDNHKPGVTEQDPINVMSGQTVRFKAKELPGIYIEVEVENEGGPNGEIFAGQYAPLTWRNEKSHQTRNLIESGHGIKMLRNGNYLLIAYETNSKRQAKVINLTNGDTTYDLPEGNIIREINWVRKR